MMYHFEQMLLKQNKEKEIKEFSIASYSKKRINSEKEIKQGFSKF